MPLIDIQPLTEDEFKQVVYALARWAETHPRPEYPVIGFSGRASITPLQLVKEVEEKTSDGMSFIRMLQIGTEVMPLEEILKRLNPPKFSTL
jgi:hypothetical protein